MKIKKLSHKKYVCIFILAVSMLFCIGAFHGRQIAHATDNQPVQSDSADQLDSADQKTSSFTFQKKMSFKVLRAAVTNGQIDTEKKVPVTTYIGDTKQEEQKNIPVGVINENTVPKITNARFVGAYVVFPKTDTEPEKETQIYYTNVYTEKSDTGDQSKTYTYYAYSPTPETGVLLEGDAYIKLKYEAAYDISYRVEDKKGNELSDGLHEEDKGGYFVTPTTKLETGNQLNIHFVEGKISGNTGSYHLRKLYKSPTSDLNKKTPISFDSDNSGKTDITQATTIVAVVDQDQTYRMHVVNPFADHHGHICWKGYSGWTYNSTTGQFEGNWTDGPTDRDTDMPIYARPKICNPDDPKAVTVVKEANGKEHGVCYADVGNKNGTSYDTKDDENGFQDILYNNQDKFDSYTKSELKDESGNVVNAANHPATTTAAPGGTFYFVMYSQRGTEWEFSRLSINGTNLKAVYDGQVHDTPIGNGMIAHFKYDSSENKANSYKDIHLEKDRNGSNLRSKQRLKFECWVSHASSDIYVDFDCVEKETESLTLTKAKGIKRIVASSYDEDHHGKLWWDSLYNGQPYYRQNGFGNWIEKNKEGKDSPNYEYTASQDEETNNLPKVLFTEKDQDSWQTSGGTHAKMEDVNGYYYDKHRYLYYDALPGYDERTINVSITGAQNNNDVKNGPIWRMPQGYYNGDLDNPVNKALDEAISNDYTNYIDYYSMHMRHRNIAISMDPYKYKATYDLDGGTLNGQSTYVDSQEYTIEKDSNHILMPTATPVKKGYAFVGWEYEPLNIKYIDQKDQLRQVLLPNEKFEINDTTYDYGLDTVTKPISYFKYVSNGRLIESYTKQLASKPVYVDKDGADNHFAFKALWVNRDNLPAGKDIYTIKTYKQVTSKDYESLNKDEKYQDATTKKLYRIVSSNDYLGTIDQTIIGIPPQADNGYVFNKQASTVKLTHFKKTGANPEPDTLKYFYDFDGSQNLTIKHVTSGNMGDQNQSFAVYVTLKDSKGNPFNGEKAVEGTNATIWGGANTTGASTTGSLKFDNGIAKISLKGNQWLTIKNVKIGSYYDIKEYSSGLYTTQYEIDQQGKSNNAISNASIVKNGNPIVTIYNVRDVPETGIYMPSDHPGQMFALLLLGAGAFYLVYKKNERRIKRIILVSTLKIEDMIKVHHK